MKGTQKKAFETHDQKVHFWQTLGTLLGWCNLRFLFTMPAPNVRGKTSISERPQNGRQQLDILFDSLII